MWLLRYWHLWLCRKIIMKLSLAMMLWNWSGRDERQRGEKSFILCCSALIYWNASNWNFANFSSLVSREQLGEKEAWRKKMFSCSLFVLYRYTPGSHCHTCLDMSRYITLEKHHVLMCTQLFFFSMWWGIRKGVGICELSLCFSEA